MYKRKPGGVGDEDEVTETTISSNVVNGIENCPDAECKDIISGKGVQKIDNSLRLDQWGKRAQRAYIMVTEAMLHEQKFALKLMSPGLLSSSVSQLLFQMLGDMKMRNLFKQPMDWTVKTCASNISREICIFDIADSENRIPNLPLSIVPRTARFV